jgi:CubicO group peptidase (beta-lactamase class C family)
MPISAVPTDRELASLAERVRAFLVRVRHETGVPGIAVALSLGGRRISVGVGQRSMRAAEPLAADARFHLGCTTKLLLAAMALELAQEPHGLDIGAALAEYLPELENTVHGRGVRISHLLSHTSGYRGTNLFEPATWDLRWESLMSHLRSAPQMFPPGSVFNYEHTESVLLGRIIERVTGRSSFGLIRERLLDPLGVVPGRLGDFEADPRGAGRHELDARSGRFLAVEGGAALGELWHAAFSTYTVSLEDLVRIGEALMADPVHTAARDAASPVPRGEHVQTAVAPRSAALLREETRRLLVQTVVRLPTMLGGPARESLPVAFGLGAAELPGRFYGNNGLTQGQCVALRFDPAARVVAAAALNATLPHLRDFVLSTVLADARPEAPAMAGSRPADARPAEVPLAQLRGRYLGPGSAVLAASLVDDRLVLELGAEGAPATRIGELVADDEQRLVLHSPIPQLSVGVFVDLEHRGPGIMLGLNAYGRFTPEG